MEGGKNTRTAGLLSKGTERQAQLRRSSKENTARDEEKKDFGRDRGQRRFKKQKRKKRRSLQLSATMAK